MRFTINVLTLAVLVSCATVPIPAIAVTLPAFDLPQIGSIDLPKKAKVDEAIQVTVKAAKDGTSECGMFVNFGDGSEQQFKINAEGVKLPISVEHAYKKAGKYTVQAKGRKITTHHSCQNSATAVIEIISVRQKAKASTPKK